jgi:hypothetical protein
MPFPHRISPKVGEVLWGKVAKSELLLPVDPHVFTLRNLRLHLRERKLSHLLAGSYFLPLAHPLNVVVDIPAPRHTPSLGTLAAAITMLMY